ncbi:hypothetical protein VNO77_21533 [Canavalia gladiata]|uniref:Uncharacterized protein n=1 Tax=Canavalia gladiata TaxID=3824 RepID=A0AAN9QM76_CANGL
MQYNILFRDTRNATCCLLFEFHYKIHHPVILTSYCSSFFGRKYLYFFGKEGKVVPVTMPTALQSLAFAPL